MLRNIENPHGKVILLSVVFFTKSRAECMMEYNEECCYCWLLPRLSIVVRNGKSREERGESKWKYPEFGLNDDDMTMTTRKVDNREII